MQDSSSIFLGKLLRLRLLPTMDTNKMAMKITLATPKALFPLEPTNQVITTNLNLPSPSKIPTLYHIIQLLSVSVTIKDLSPRQYGSTAPLRLLRLQLQLQPHSL